MDNNDQGKDANFYIDKVIDGSQEEKFREAQKKDNTAHDLGIASLILGIIALVFAVSCCCTYVSIIFSIIGLILGIMARDSHNNIDKLATIGIVCSIIAIVCFIAIVILSICGVLLDQNKALNAL